MTSRSLHYANNIKSKSLTALKFSFPPDIVSIVLLARVCYNPITPYCLIYSMLEYHLKYSLANNVLFTTPIS